MLNQFSRTQLLLGPEAMNYLAQCRVAVFGVGGVGGYTVEALARSGIGALDLIDDDKVCLTNLNRQIYATRSTVGRYKVDVAEERIKDINPDCKVTIYKTFYLPETQDQFDFTQYDYVVDAIDTVKGKLALVEQAKAADTPIICAMGAGNKLDPTAFKVADTYTGKGGRPCADFAVCGKVLGETAATNQENCYNTYAAPFHNNSAATGENVPGYFMSDPGLSKNGYYQDRNSTKIFLTVETSRRVTFTDGINGLGGISMGRLHTTWAVPSKVWDAQYIYPAHNGRANLAVYSGGVMSVEPEQLVFYFGHKWLAASGTAQTMHFNRSLATYMVDEGSGSLKYSQITLPDPGKQY